MAVCGPTSFLVLLQVPQSTLHGVLRREVGGASLQVRIERLHIGPEPRYELAGLLEMMRHVALEPVQNAVHAPQPHLLGPLPR